MMDLARAVVCVNCDALFDVSERRCPRCTSEVFSPVATWLNRSREEIEA